MKLVSWNVNGIRAIANKGFLDWLEGTGADVVCLQETKAWTDQLGEELLRPQGYVSVFAQAKRKGYSGVAIYSRERWPVRTLGIPEFDDEGRVLIATLPGNLQLFNCYFPNSQEAGARLDYKIAFCEAILEAANRLVAEGAHVAICGDFNVAHRPIDLTHPDANETSPGYLPEERAWMDKFLEAGYLDTFRLFDPRPQQYTWWSYRSQARERNVGWRIDYFCTSAGFRPHIKAAAIHPEVQGSDHCPVSLDIDG